VHGSPVFITIVIAEVTLPPLPQPIKDGICLLDLAILAEFKAELTLLAWLYTEVVD